MREVAVSGGSTVYVSKDRLAKLLSISLPLDVKGAGSGGGESNVPYFFFRVQLLVIVYSLEIFR